MNKKKQDCQSDLGLFCFAFLMVVMMMMSMMMMMMISTNNAFGDYEGDNGQYEGRLICFDGYYVYHFDCVDKVGALNVNNAMMGMATMMTLMTMIQIST